MGRGKDGERAKKQGAENLNPRKHNILPVFLQRLSLR